MAMHRGLPGKYVPAVLTMSARNCRKKKRKKPKPVAKNEKKNPCLLSPDWDETVATKPQDKKRDLPTSHLLLKAWL